MKIKYILIIPQSYEMVYIKNLEKGKFWKWCGKKEVSFTVSGIGNWFSICGKEHVDLKNLNIGVPYESSFLLLDIYPKKTILT